MMSFVLCLLLFWAISAAFLWLLQSEAACGAIHIGWRDRLAALFCLPLLIGLTIWTLLCWVHDRGRCL
jgi:hypothetical protein